MARAAEQAENADLDLQHFVQQLAVRLTGWEATTFLVGEYQPSEAEQNPVFTVADGLLWLYQSLDRNSMVRKMQVMKMRGQAPIPGLHTFRITDDGIQVFPRVIVGPAEKSRPAVPGDEARATKAAFARRQGIGRDARRGHPGRLFRARGRPLGVRQDRARHRVHHRGRAQ